MEKKAGTLTILLIIVIVVSLALAGGGFYMLNKEQKKSLDLYDRLGEISTKQRTTEAKLRESEKFIADLQQRLSDAKTQMDALSTGLQQEQAARQEATAKLELLSTDLEEQKALRADLEKKLTQAQEDVRKTQAQLSDLQSQKATLESKIKDLEAKAQERVELGNIVVSPEAPVPAEIKDTKEKTAQEAEDSKAPSKQAKQAKENKPTVGKKLEGKVLVVNKDYNFIVISLGSKEGVSLGGVFEVHHNKKYIGDVRIEKVHDSMSAAGFVNADLKNWVSEGDKVTQKVK